MKENEVVEILPDGTVHYYDLDICVKEAEKMLDELYSKEDTVQNFDAVAAMYAIFLEAIYVLNHSGMTTEELIEEVLTHTVVIDEDDDSDDDFHEE